MPPTPDPAPLSRRERQLMDVLYERGRATVAEVVAALPDAPSYSAVRTLLGVLVTKGHAVHSPEGRAYVYAPAVPRDAARQGAVSRLVRTFFDGSPTQLVATLLTEERERLSPADLDALAALIEQARREGR